MYQRSILRLGCACAVAAAGSIASACVMQDTNPPLPNWIAIKSQSPLPGFIRQQVYMNVGLFPPATPTPCVCGFGVSTFGGTISGIVPGPVQVTIYDAGAGSVVGTVPQFDTLAFNANTTAAFNNTSLYPAGAGYNWLGFGGMVNPFVPPVLAPGQFFAWCFVFDIPANLDPILKLRLGCLAGGIGDANFNPIFDGHPHAVGAPFACRPIPAPGALAMLAPATIAALAQRRRRRD